MNAIDRSPPSYQYTHTHQSPPSLPGLIANEYAVISTYVPRIEEMGLNVNERWEVGTNAFFVCEPNHRT